jgi:hypothetical protein
MHKKHAQSIANHVVRSRHGNWEIQKTSLRWFTTLVKLHRAAAARTLLESLLLLDYLRYFYVYAAVPESAAAALIIHKNKSECMKRVCTRAWLRKRNLLIIISQASFVVAWRGVGGLYIKNDPLDARGRNYKQVSSPLAPATLTVLCFFVKAFCFGALIN